MSSDNHPLAAPEQTGLASSGSAPNEPPPPYDSIVLDNAAALPPQLEPVAGPSATKPAAASKDEQTPGAKAGFYGAPKNPDFKIVVTDPVRQGEGVAAYVSYKVISTINLSQYNRAHNEVIRRFRDFVWLQRRLRREYRGTIVPALPEKNVLEKYKMTTEFINQRRAALEIFLNRLAAHPTLRTSTDLQLFLEANETEFAIEVSRTQEDSSALAATSSASGAAQKALGGAMRLFKSISSSTSSGIAARPSRPDEEEDPEYLKARTYVTELEPYLVDVHKQVARVVKSHADFAVALEEFGGAMSALTRCVDAEKDASISQLFADLEKKAAAAAAVSQRTAGFLALKLEAPVKDFHRTVRAAKRVTTDRSNVLSERHQAVTDVEIRRARLAKLRNTVGMKEERVAEAERDLRDAQLRAQEYTELYSAMSSKMRGEFARFQQERALDFAWVLKELSKVEVKAATEAAKVWS